MENDENKMVSDNLTLVHWVLWRLVHVPPEDYMDAFSEGCIGLLKAVRTYAPDKKVTFRTYAVNCIRNSILRFCRKENNRRKWRRIVEQKTSRDIESETPDEIVEKNDYLRDIMSRDDRGVIRLLARGYTQREIADSLGIAQPTVSRIIKRWRNLNNGRR